jgi:hypothetical protein
MENVCALTTIDNPFDPFDQFSQWFLFDTEKGYNSCSYLARIAQTSDEMSEQEYNHEVERAIDEIVTINPLGIYKKVTKPQVN